MTEWISVDERLPEPYVFVLIHDELPAIDPPYKTSSIRLCHREIYKNGESAWVCGGGWYFGHNITHWMPLPEPPKGEQT